MATLRPNPNEALYEVNVWNYTTGDDLHSILTTGAGLAEAVDAMEQWVADNVPKDHPDELFLIVGRA